MATKEIPLSQRDESWLRWKGGDKLAADLRLFYTAPHALKRLGESQPFQAATKSMSNGKRVIANWYLAQMSGRRSHAGSLPIGKVLEAARRANKAPSAPASVPGQTAPRR